MSLTAIQGLISLGVRTDEVLQLVTSSLPLHTSESFDWLVHNDLVNLIMQSYYYSVMAILFHYYIS